MNTYSQVLWLVFKYFDKTHIKSYPLPLSVIYEYEYLIEAKHL